MYDLLDAYMSHDETLHDMYEAQFCDEYAEWSDGLGSIADDDDSFECDWWHEYDVHLIQQIEAAPLLFTVKGVVLA